MALSFEERLNLSLVPSLMFDPVGGRQLLLSSPLTPLPRTIQLLGRWPTASIVEPSHPAPTYHPTSALIFPAVPLLNIVFIRKRLIRICSPLDIGLF
jgi:hypothetical protein